MRWIRKNTCKHDKMVIHRGLQKLNFLLMVPRSPSSSPCVPFCFWTLDNPGTWLMALSPPRPPGPPLPLLICTTLGCIRCIWLGLIDWSCIWCMHKKSIQLWLWSLSLVPFCISLSISLHVLACPCPVPANSSTYRRRVLIEDQRTIGWLEDYRNR